MRFSLAAAILLSFVSSAVAQTSSTPTSSSTQALTTLQSALAALTRNTTVSDITLTGTGQRIVGSDNETGSATYRAISSANRLDLSLSGGTWSEIRALSSNVPAGNWIGPNGTVNEIAFHNLLTDAGWFPIFTLGNVISGTNSLLTYVGPETKNGVSVIHVQVTQQPQSTNTSSQLALLEHLAQMDFYLDASTLLPVALDFNTHADNNALSDIAVEFRFSNYTSVGSLNIPFHVQKFLNGSLFEDVQFQQASINSGLSSSSSFFAIQ
jgi:hypothetical protein